MVDKDSLVRAGALIRRGGLVAFPTETVYGLGANAFDPVAVARIYRVKKRPSASPLIVHVDSVGMAKSLARAWPETAGILAERFWPGPLTLVLPKQPSIPDAVTAGLDTVGLRMPDHPVALALIREAGVPIAAPSANPFTRLSPTKAGHVRGGLGSAVDMILDAGPTRVGIESTVLSLAGEKPVLLRPGMVSREAIEALIGPVEAAALQAGGGAHPSPGMHRKHYSPATPLFVVEGGAVPATGRGAYLWIRQEAQAARSIPMPRDAAGYASVLYEVLHRLDAEGWDWIAVERPPETAAWAAVSDRLSRAAASPGGR